MHAKIVFPTCRTFALRYCLTSISSIHHGKHTLMPADRTVAGRLPVSHLQVMLVRVLHVLRHKLPVMQLVRPVSRQAGRVEALQLMILAYSGPAGYEGRLRC